MVDPRELVLDAQLFLLLLVATSLVNFGAGLTAFLIGINDVRAQVVIDSTRAFVLLAVTGALGGSIGVVAVGVAAVASEILASAVLPILYVRRHIQEVDGKECFSAGGWRWHRPPCFSWSE